MLGYGASDVVETLSYQRIADAVVQLLDDLGVARATLVGESFGGMHALHTAIHYPDRDARLVLTNTSPAFGMDGTVAEELQAARLGPLDAGQQPSDFAEAVLASIAGPGLSDEAMKMRVAAFGRISAVALRVAIECLPSNDVRGHLAASEAPIRFNELVPDFISEHPLPEEVK